MIYVLHYVHEYKEHVRCHLLGASMFTLKKRVCERARSISWLNSATVANISDIVAEQLAAIATDKKMPVGLNFGDRHGNATILDFDDDSQHQ